MNIKDCDDVSDVNSMSPNQSVRSYQSNFLKTTTADRQHLCVNDRKNSLYPEATQLAYAAAWGNKLAVIDDFESLSVQSNTPLHYGKSTDALEVRRAKLLEKLQK